MDWNKLIEDFFGMFGDMVNFLQQKPQFYVVLFLAVFGLLDVLVFILTRNWKRGKRNKTITQETELNELPELPELPNNPGTDIPEWKGGEE